MGIETTESIQQKTLDELKNEILNYKNPNINKTPFDLIINTYNSNTEVRNYLNNHINGLSNKNLKKKFELIRNYYWNEILEKAKNTPIGEKITNTYQKYYNEAKKLYSDKGENYRESYAINLTVSNFLPILPEITQYLKLYEAPIEIQVDSNSIPTLNPLEGYGINQNISNNLLQQYPILKILPPADKINNETKAKITSLLNRLKEGNEIEITTYIEILSGLLQQANNEFKENINKNKTAKEVFNNFTENYKTKLTNNLSSIIGNLKNGNLLDQNFSIDFNNLKLQDLNKIIEGILNDENIYKQTDQETLNFLIRVKNYISVNYDSLNGDETINLNTYLENYSISKFLNLVKNGQLQELNSYITDKNKQINEIDFQKAKKFIEDNKTDFEKFYNMNNIISTFKQIFHNIIGDKVNYNENLNHFGETNLQNLDAKDFNGYNSAKKTIEKQYGNNYKEKFSKIKKEKLINYFYQALYQNPNIKTFFNSLNLEQIDTFINILNHSNSAENFKTTILNYKNDNNNFIFKNSLTQQNINTNTFLTLIFNNKTKLIQNYEKNKNIENKIYEKSMEYLVENIKNYLDINILTYNAQGNPNKIINISQLLKINEKKFETDENGNINLKIEGNIGHYPLKINYNAKTGNIKMNKIFDIQNNQFIPQSEIEIGNIGTIEKLLDNIKFENGNMTYPKIKIDPNIKLGIKKQIIINSIHSEFLRANLKFQKLLKPIQLSNINFNKILTINYEKLNNYISPQSINILQNYTNNLKNNIQIINLEDLQKIYTNISIISQNLTKLNITQLNKPFPQKIYSLLNQIKFGNFTAITQPHSSPNGNLNILNQIKNIPNTELQTLQQFV